MNGYTLMIAGGLSGAIPAAISIVEKNSALVSVRNVFTAPDWRPADGGGAVRLLAVPRC
jgi:hypothetical protein